MMRAVDARGAIEQPLLRGWLHLIAIVPAMLGTAALVLATQERRALQLSLIVYGFSLVLLFAVSATYHVPHWPERWKLRWKRLDHAAIFVVIAGTNTPVIGNVLQGPLRTAMLATIWGLAGAGVLLCLTPLDLPRPVFAGAYVAVGWAALAVLPALVVQLGPSGLALLLTGGMLYSIGALVYALQRPVLWPRVFGYHELFHLMVVAASAVFFALIATDVVAVHRG